MPYGSNASLPSAVKALPPAGQAIYRSAFNSAFKQYKSESRAHAVAWSAVKRKFRKSGSKWVAKDAGMRDSQPFSWDERVFLDAANYRVTEAGYLVAQPRVARTGIQEYAGFEMGVVDMDKVRVFRPEEQVFDKRSLLTFAHKPVTLDHPDENVNAENWTDYAIGHIEGEVARDGEFIRVPMMLCDKTAVDAVRSGKAELSVGYSAELVWGEGKTPAGDTYDAMQTDIAVNHVAVVDRARGGPLLRVGDSDKGHRSENMKTIVIDGISVEVEDKDAQIIERHVKKVTDDLASAIATAKASGDASVAQITTLTKERDDSRALVANKDVEIAALKQQVADAVVTPQKLEAMVREKAVTVGKARAILGDKLVHEGKSDAEIRKQVVDAKMGDSAKAYTEENIKVAFDIFTTGVKAADDKGAGGGTGGGDDFRRALGDPSSLSDAQRRVEEAYNDRDKLMSEAWKQPLRGGPTN